MTIGESLGVHLTRWGWGPTIVCLHGFTHDGESFEQLAGQLRDYELVAPDLPGHGRTMLSPELEIDFDTTLELLRDVVGSTGSEPVHLLGYSMGGRIALQLALEVPECVETLTLISAAPGIADATERAARLDRDLELADRIEADGLDAFVDAWEAMPVFAGLTTLPVPDRRAIRAMRMRQSARGLAAALRGLSVGRQPNNWPDLETLTMPVLTITGSEDAKFTEIARRMQPTCAGATLDGVGHAAHLEAPGRTATAIRAFLE